MLIALRRVTATAAAIALLVYGMVAIDEHSDASWLVCLGLAGICLLFAWWPSGTRSLIGRAHV